MPAARADLQRGYLLVELVYLSRFVGEADLAPDRIAEIHLPLDLVEPVRAVGILEIGHIGIGARVERVDDHLALDRPGDLDAPAFQRLRQRGDFPVAVAHGFRFGQKVRHLASIDACLARNPGLQQFLAPCIECAMQLGDEDQAHRG